MSIRSEGVDIALTRAFGDDPKAGALEVLSDGEWHTREEIVIRTGHAPDVLQVALGDLEQTKILQGGEKKWRLNVRHPIALFVAGFSEGEFL